MEKFYSTIDISKICDVTKRTVILWVEKGSLPAYKTPGGYRRILHNDLMGFLKKYNFPIPEELTIEKKIKILIIGDGKRITKSLKKIIQKKIERCDVYITSDGFEAGRIFTKLQPEVVFLDIFFLRIDGFNVCKLIRKYEENKTVIIAITGFDSKKNKRKIFLAGADYYFKKPVDNDKILQIIDFVCKGMG